MVEALAVIVVGFQGRPSLDDGGLQAVRWRHCGSFECGTAATFHNRTQVFQYTRLGSRGLYVYGALAHVANRHPAGKTLPPHGAVFSVSRRGSSSDSSRINKPPWRASSRGVFNRQLARFWRPPRRIYGVARRPCAKLTLRATGGSIDSGTVPEQNLKMSQGTGPPAHSDSDAVLARRARRVLGCRALRHQECHRVEAMRAAFPDMEHDGGTMEIRMWHGSKVPLSQRNVSIMRH